MILPTGRGLPDWTAGTATATPGQRNVSFVGAGLIAVDPTTGAQLYGAGRGDFFMIDGVDAVQISAVIDANTIQLARPWSAAAQNGVAYAIIRMSIPASGSVAKAIKDIYDQGSDAKPDTTRTLDDSTARIKVDPHAGAPSIRVGPTGAADAALLTGIQFDKDTGAASFPRGLLLPAMGFHNRIINGNFDVWQRGAAFSVGVGASPYTADRFMIGNMLGVGVSVSKVAAPAGFSGLNAINWQATGVPAGGYCELIQRFESQMVWDLDSQDCVLSFDLNASTNAGALSLTVYGQANTAPDNNSWTSLRFISNLNVPGGTSRIQVPIGAANAASFKNGIQIGIRVAQAGATGNPNVTIGAVHLEKGLVANPFEFRPLGAELMLCQRYFWASGVTLFRANSSGVFAGGLVNIGTPVPMRAVPTLAVPSIGGNYLVNPTLTAITNDMLQFWFTTGSNPGDYTSFGFTASAEL